MFVVLAYFIGQYFYAFESGGHLKMVKFCKGVGIHDSPLKRFLKEIGVCYQYKRNHDMEIYLEHSTVKGINC